jgi:hypothetical protein
MRRGYPTEWAGPGAKVTGDSQTAGGVKFPREWVCRLRAARSGVYRRLEQVVRELGP